MKKDSGFTLLEIMVALSIIAIALTVLLTSQSQSLSLAREAKFDTIASLLAQSKVAEIEAGSGNELQEDTGDFGDDFPDYSWEIKHENVSLSGEEEFTRDLDRIDLIISCGSDKQYEYNLRLYRFVPNK